MRLPLRIRRVEADGVPAGYVPADPRAVLSGPLDPSLLAVRSGLASPRRRLWARRIVRRFWLALAAVFVAELVLWTVARLLPIEWAPQVAVAIPVVGALGLLVAAVQARPSIGETALALDGEAHLGDRVSSALELAVAFPESAGPDTTFDAVDESEAAKGDRFVRRQRIDALAALRLAPSSVFRARLSRRPAAVAFVAALLLAPVLLIPNPQAEVIAQQRQVREAAERQADRLDDLARELDSKGVDTQDPRTRLAEELRDLARQLRERPAGLDVNLARLGSIESDVRARIDPATEQRAASLTSLSRSLSRAATGKPDANRDGDPEQTAEDLERLSEELDDKTEQELAELARQLAEQEANASGASGAASQALRDAAQSLAQGDTEGARSALDRLRGGPDGHAERRRHEPRPLGRRVTAPGGPT